MPDVYKRLAKKLDSLPHGFPATESGVELRVLRKIFSPEDAEFALKLKPLPETAEQIAKRLRQPVDRVEKTLGQMAANGQIGSFKMKGQQRYMLMPFVVGIYEFQLARLDKELADLVEEYMPSLMKVIGGYKPAVARVVPVNKSIDAKLEILPYEDMRRAMSESRSFLVNECICRKEKGLQGQPCRHTKETCMAFSREEAAFDNFRYAGRVIDKEEALRILDESELEGLVHASFNIQQDPAFVCNCCSCCCGFIRGIKEFHAPYVITRSNFMARIDQESCSACGACADDRCPMEAIQESNGGYSVLAERCIGCGVCAVACSTESIRLVRRPVEEQTVPPKNIVHWAVERSSARSGLLKRLALRFWLARHGGEM
jgi:electron transport complex protein RnfB